MKNNHYSKFSKLNVNLILKLSLKNQAEKSGEMFNFLSDWAGVPRNEVNLLCWLFSEKLVY